MLLKLLPCLPAANIVSTVTQYCIVVEILPGGVDGKVYSFNNIAADVLATQGARASAAMMLTESSPNILTSASQDLTTMDLCKSTPWDCPVIPADGLSRWGSCFVKHISVWFNSFLLFEKKESQHRCSIKVQLCTEIFVLRKFWVTYSCEREAISEV